MCDAFMQLPFKSSARKGFSVSTHFPKTTARRAPFKTERPAEFDIGIANVLARLFDIDKMPMAQEFDCSNQKHPSPPMREWWG
nr:MAG TPA_asm: hypothetical protein [Caudoviricetes sp.]